ncbi:MAG: fluoride efflux transporter CrcB [Bacteroidales bacterium]|nr:fluoride efflux transporter CrcB [Bacteroidales bacterium]
MNTMIAIFIGGGLGSVTRFGISKFITSDYKEINPVGTLTANVISTVILGVILYLSADKFIISPTIKALLIIGFCGGFSTFSTFSYETFELLRTGNYYFAAANLLVSIFLGVGVLFILARSI